MPKENKCRTYFAIVGDFDPDMVSKRLGIEPYCAWKKDDLRKDGKPYGFARWECGFCNDYDPMVTNMMEKTIEPLLGKIKELNAIREENEVRFYLGVVPEFYINTVTPCVSPSLKVIDFAHETRTEIDIDPYVYR